MKLLLISILLAAPVAADPPDEPEGDGDGATTTD